MNVLSLFDGMSCGQIALKKAGIPVSKYYASEIDKHAIKVTQHNHPNTIQLGSVTQVTARELPIIDLLIGGSPCQGFSFAGKQLNFQDPRSQLFFEYVRILQEIREYNPNVLFLLENVKMKKEYQAIITQYLGVEPIEINSALVSAQNRRRLYWTNIPNIQQPQDKGILLKDIIHENAISIDGDKSATIKSQYGKSAEANFLRKGSFHATGLLQVDKITLLPNFNVNPSGKGMNGNVYDAQNPKSNTLTTNKGEGQKIAINLAQYIVPFDKTLKILEKEVQSGKVGYFRKDSQANRVYYIHDKAVEIRETLCGIIQTPRGHNTGGLRNDGTKSTTLSSHSWEQNNHLLFGCITPDRINKRQNGQRFSEGRKFYTLTSQDQHGVLVEGYIRKLTPIECERLQTVPDNYTSIASNSQRYKMLGNGWTVDVITHIFQNINNH